jgi:hypothetical protein
MTGLSRSAIVLSFVFICVVLPNAWAEEWKSPDGNVSVTVPAPARFKAHPADSKVLGGWQTEDELLTLMITEKGNPSAFPLALKPVVEGFEKSAQQELKIVTSLGSATITREGHDLLTMTCSGELGKVTIFVTQLLFATERKVYYAIVRGVGFDTRTDPDVSTFLSTFKPLTPTLRVVHSPNAAPLGRSNDQTTDAPVQKTLAYQMGKLAAYLL